MFCGFFLIIKKLKNWNKTKIKGNVTGTIWFVVEFGIKNNKIGVPLRNSIKKQRKKIMINLVKK